MEYDKYDYDTIILLQKNSWLWLVIPKCQLSN
jgi:hypothetical protein